MANKTLYPFGVGGQTASGIEIIDDLEHNDATKALSAKQGKILADYVFAGSGTYRDAFEKSKTTTAYFPWLLIDEDENGAPIKKMIWHVGNGAFIDAIGAEINGVKNGITIKADGSGYLTFNGGGLSTAGRFDYSGGETNYSFAEVADIIKTANANSSSTYDGSTFSDMGITNSDATFVEIDFGGMRFTGTHLLYNNPSVFTKFKRLNIGNGSNCSLMRASSTSTKLNYLQLVGTRTATTMPEINDSATNGLTEADLSMLYVPNLTNVNSFLSALQNWSLKRVDIRNLDTSNVTNMDSFLFRREGLSVLIIGNFSTEAVTTSTNFMARITSLTVVCTRDTPPNIGFDWLSGHVAAIKVPNKTVEITTIDDNTQEETTTTTTVLSLYQNHVKNDGDEVGTSGWSKYANIMSTYEEGEY